MAVGLGSTDQGFLKNKLGTGLIGDIVDNFASGFGRPRINTIQGMKDYWKDFMNEMKFMEEGENKPVKIDGYWYTYRLPGNFPELLRNIQFNEDDKAGTTASKPIIISLICAVEGLHVLNCGLEKNCDPDEVKKHARELKTLPHSPWFITFSHHFYNELCGHARSLRGLIGKATNQERGISTDFTPLGKEVLDILLDKNNGRRILVDIKHMSPLARKTFFDLRRTRYNSEIPIFISHGVCNGLPTLRATFSKYPELGNTFINPPENEMGDDGPPKNHNAINFYDDVLLSLLNT